MEYKVGQSVSGTVSGITDYGVFVQLENGGTGMIHISKLSNSFVSDIRSFSPVYQSNSLYYVFGALLAVIVVLIVAAFIVFGGERYFDKKRFVNTEGENE